MVRLSMAERRPAVFWATCGLTSMVLGDMRRHVHGSQLIHEILGVVALVGSERDAPKPVGSFLDHGKGGGALGLAVRLRHATVDDQPVAVLHEGVAHEAELGFPASTFAVEPRRGIRGALVRVVGQALAMEIHLGLAPAGRGLGMVGRSALLEFEALRRGPSLDQGAVDAEMVATAGF